MQRCELKDTLLSELRSRTLLLGAFATERAEASNEIPPVGIVRRLPVGVWMVGHWLHRQTFTVPSGGMDVTTDGSVSRGGGTTVSMATHLALAHRPRPLLR